jgi:hypothetical protein
MTVICSRLTNPRHDDISCRRIDKRGLVVAACLMLCGRHVDSIKELMRMRGVEKRKATLQAEAKPTRVKTNGKKAKPENITTSIPIAFKEKNPMRIKQQIMCFGL